MYRCAGRCQCGVAPTIRCAGDIGRAFHPVAVSMHGRVVAQKLSTRCIRTLSWTIAAVAAERSEHEPSHARRMGTRFCSATADDFDQSEPYVNLNMDPRKDFAPIGLIASMPIAARAPLVAGQDSGEVFRWPKRMRASSTLERHREPAATCPRSCSKRRRSMLRSSRTRDAPVMNDLVAARTGALACCSRLGQAGTLRRLRRRKERFSLYPTCQHR